MIDMLDFIKNNCGKSLSADQVHQLNPLVLAYIGDTVYDLFIRTYLVCTHDASVNELNKLAISYVKASAQSKTLGMVFDNLSDSEKDIVRRGRNAKSGTIPKNADLAEYKRATGFEALIGYLFLSGQEARLFEIINLILAENR